MWDTWQHLLTPHTRGSDGSLTQSWVSWCTVQSCLSLRRIVKWMCWRSNVFASSSDRNLVRQPQKRTKCYNKHSEKQRWVGPIHLSGIPDLKTAARPSTMTRTQAGHQRREPTRLLTVSMQYSVRTDVWRSERLLMNSTCHLAHAKRYWHRILEWDVCRQNLFPTRPWVSGNSWPSTASPWFPTRLLTRFGPLRLLPLPQAEQNPEGDTISRRRGDTTKYDTAV
jgi:hypothetical protein